MTTILSISGLSLTRAEHDLTHQHGESALRPPEWFDVKAAECLDRWLDTLPATDRQLVVDYLREQGRG